MGLVIIKEVEVLSERVYANLWGAVGEPANDILHRLR